ncbi:helix-turn-helix domain-containing protein [Rhodoblastus sp. 17X3]|uniref:helix-turn-helix domain-containing protein n=1 Tax=Rhodoblastus sp. 17X3 TaxID=3047026 RepID=UPI0024B67ED6|nr:helix-turn-helix domain-containing protein [Rhodoblastus sp. 17X3]MDI9849818.1 helix-turn-helix domain-containing protein [Rhodoblastus sp. 17X3]
MGLPSAPARMSQPDAPCALSPEPARGNASSWSAVFAGVFEIGGEASTLADDGKYIAHATANHVLSQSRCPSLRLARSDTAIAQCALDVFALRLQLSGRAAARIGESGVEAGEGDLMFLDMKQPLDLTLAAGDSDAADVTIWVPRRKLRAAMSRADALHGFVVAGTSPAGALIGGCLRLLAEQAKKISAEQMDALCDGVVALIAKALAPELAGLGGAESRSHSSLAIIRRHIDQHLTLPGLNADSLTKRFGLSRASLYRLFEPVGGVAGYIRQARLDRAYQELMASENSSRRIGPIAYSLGFRNVSAFNRLFKAHYGVSPREARERTPRIAPAIPAPASPAPHDRNALAYWLALIGAPRAK